MNNLLNNKVRPKYYQLIHYIPNRTVVGFCALYKATPPPGWTEIDENEYEYLVKITEKSHAIGRTK